jgi:sugar phosphate isomerase/epimerase
LPVFHPDAETNPLADLRGFRRLPAGWDIEWHRFFDGLTASGPDTQTTRPFDPFLAPALNSLPGSIDKGGRSLALLNLMRGVALELPSGEEVALAVAAKTGITPINVETGLSHPAPLWFWILKEAEAAGATSLGPVGGRIVAEVLVGLAENDPSSFLRVQPDWTPTLAPGIDDFSMADLLRIAGASS